MFRYVNDAELRELIIEHLNAVADELRNSSDRTDINVDLLDRAGLGVTVSVTAGAIGAIVATGGALAPFILLGAGIGGTAVCGVGRTAMKRRSVKNKSDARKIDGLVAKLRTLP